jgi:hypothetical protein
MIWSARSSICKGISPVLALPITLRQHFGMPYLDGTISEIFGDVVEIPRCPL